MSASRPAGTSPATAAVRTGLAADLRRLGGVFYTPPRLAEMLADWALKPGPQRILEPSYGHGVFLAAARKNLAAAGVEHPERRLFGVEIDPAGPERLTNAGLSLPADHLFRGDLLEFDLQALGGRFGAIIGNPPYIRHHLLGRELADRGARSARALGIELNGRSDAWAYFCAHLMTFLADDGRLALILPGSTLQADYAKPLIEAFAAERGEVQLIRISERLFPSVQERTVLLLIDRARNGDGSVIYRRIADLDGLRSGLSRRPARPQRSGSGVVGHEHAMPWRLRKPEAKLWEEIRADVGVCTLGDQARVRIGVVTGANSFFVRPAAEVERLGKAIASVPIVSRGGWLAGPRWGTEEQGLKADRPSRLLLFPSTSRMTARLREEVKRGEEEGLAARSHCERRESWYRITDTAPPDLFLPYMGSRPPRLVANDAGATCTNAIHRVWLESGAGLEAEALAAASWTTLFRLSAELVGRSYGGGVLKLEPNGATGLLVPAAVPSDLLAQIETAHASGGVAAATALADRRLLVEFLGLDADQVAMLVGAAERLEALRRR